MNRCIFLFLQMVAGDRMITIRAKGQSCVYVVRKGLGTHIEECWGAFIFRNGPYYWNHYRNGHSSVALSTLNVFYMHKSQISSLHKIVSSKYSKTCSPWWLSRGGVWGAVIVQRCL